MKPQWRIALLLGSAVLICGAAIVWHFARVRASQRKLTDEAKMYRLRAEHGDADAQYHLAGMFYRGQGVPQDYAEAADLYRKAADQGNAKAEYGLAFMYYEGKGVPRDSVAAVSWCRRAAGQGYAKAQDALGSTYYEGKDLRTKLRYRCRLVPQSR
jgi:TPR repeat protein